MNNESLSLCVGLFFHEILFLHQMFLLHLNQLQNKKHFLHQLNNESKQAPCLYVMLLKWLKVSVLLIEITFFFLIRDSRGFRALFVWRGSLMYQRMNHFFQSSYSCIFLIHDYLWGYINRHSSPKEKMVKKCWRNII